MNQKKITAALGTSAVAGLVVYHLVVGTAPHLMVVSADFPALVPPHVATVGFFMASTDLVNWVTVEAFPYPTNGATVACTNVMDGPRLFVKAGAE